METAGVKFFASLTNDEIGSLERTTGMRLEDWEAEASGVKVNGATLKVASMRSGSPLGDAQIGRLTPKQTQERLEEILEELGFVDDPEEVGPDLPQSESTS